MCAFVRRRRWRPLLVDIDVEEGVSWAGRVTSQRAGPSQSAKTSMRGVSAQILSFLRSATPLASWALFHPTDHLADQNSRPEPVRESTTISPSIRSRNVAVETSSFALEDEPFES
jgi:hypothetical protein